jgi:U3 small nucleolar RNA-associated protein 11
LQDYVLRAKDFNFKKQRLKALQQKAATKNPDEFYFHMQSSSLKVPGLSNRRRRSMR